MKIQVGLLDESAIIQKMLSHCLHYFVVNIHPFKTWDECLLHTNNENLSILFVDWAMFHGKTRLIDLAREQLSSTPAVLMHRQESTAELSNKNIPYRIQKPLNPKQVRDIFSKLVPQINESSIQSFLHFPKAPSSSQPSPPPSPPQTAPLQPQKQLSPQKASQTKQSSPLPALKRDTRTQEQITSFSGGTKTNTTPAQKSSDIGLSYLQEKASSIKPSLLKSKKFDKSEIVLNENTKNDLAPMAIKSSDSKKTVSSDSSKLTEEQILEVLKKYKDSLEFTQLMEKVLSEHAKKALSSLLEPNQTQKLLKESMQDFQSGENFKKQVDEEISRQIRAYLKEELPLKMKSIIQEEIKKILQD